MGSEWMDQAGQMSAIGFIVCKFSSVGLDVVPLLLHHSPEFGTGSGGNLFQVSIHQQFP